MKKLTALAIKAALGALAPIRTATGCWLLRLQRDGKLQGISLGGAKMLLLLEDLRKASELRKAIKIDRRDVLAERKDEAAAKMTFREVTSLLDFSPTLIGVWP